MKIFKSILCFILLALTIGGCSVDDSTDEMTTPFVVAFENLSGNLGEITTTQDINLVYSETTTASGLVRVTLEATNAQYGTDFTTTPPLDGNEISVPISAGQNETAIVFTKLSSSLNETVEIRFTISEVTYPNAVIQGNTTFTLNSAASLGRGFEPIVGGPNEQNQVYIDLSTETQSPVQRDTWDLGFYGGTDFRVGINTSIYMAAKQLESTNIDAVTQADVADIQDEVAVGTFDPTNAAYIDNPDGDIAKTAIAPISASDSDNKVYLVNLGYQVGTEVPAPGSVAIAGDTRGWKKIRILRQGNGYLLQYADLNDTSHQEITIEKNSEYNFTFFNLKTANTVLVAPKTENWDINFTVFTNVITGAGSYGFSDGVLHNRKGGVTAYLIDTDQTSIAYDDFNLNNVNSGSFLSDQRAIGSSWRDVFDRIVFENIYYIIKDPNGNIYKLKFTGLVNDAGERGFPEFKYNLLQ